MSLTNLENSVLAAANAVKSKVGNKQDKLSSGTYVEITQKTENNVTKNVVDLKEDIATKISSLLSMLGDQNGDSDSVINKWNEVVAFLAGINEDSTLSGLLSDLSGRIQVIETLVNEPDPATSTVIDSVKEIYNFLAGIDPSSTTLSQILANAGNTEGIEALVRRAETAATNAEGSASTASTKASDASDSATAAAGSATSASTSATNASASATAAAGSATDANTAKTAAETANTNAQSAKTAAQTAQTAAETAKNGAVSAKTAAETAQAAAEAAAEAAKAAAGYYVVCETAAEAAAKTATLDGFTDAKQTAGVKVAVKFTNANTASNPTFKLGGATAANIKYQGSNVVATLLKNRTYLMVYADSAWNIIGDLDTDLSMTLRTVNGATPTTTIAVNEFVSFGTVTALTVSLAQPSASAAQQNVRYGYEFDSGNTAPTITLPLKAQDVNGNQVDVVWPAEFADASYSIDANTHYEMSIKYNANNKKYYGLLQQWPA